MGGSSPLPVHGPTGVSEVVEGLNRAYRHDQRYRHDHHGDEVAPLSGFGLVARPFEPPAEGELHTVLAEGDLKIEALRVDHSPVAPAVGYRFTYKDRTALITGDTIPLENIRKFAQGIDLLVHEALSPKLVGMMRDIAVEQGNRPLAKVLVDIPGYHTSPSQAAETARDAGVRHMLLYHIVPPLASGIQRSIFLDGVDEIFSDVTVGQDGTSFSIPAGSTEVQLTREAL